MHAFPWALAKYQIGLTINVHAIYTIRTPLITNVELVYSYGTVEISSVAEKAICLNDTSGFA